MATVSPQHHPQRLQMRLASEKELPPPPPPKSPRRDGPSTGDDSPKEMQQGSQDLSPLSAALPLKMAHSIVIGVTGAKAVVVNGRPGQRPASEGSIGPEPQWLKPASEPPAEQLPFAPAPSTVTRKKVPTRKPVPSPASLPTISPPVEPSNASDIRPLRPSNADSRDNESQRKFSDTLLLPEVSLPVSLHDLMMETTSAGSEQKDLPPPPPEKDIMADKATGSSLYKRRNPSAQLSKLEMATIEQEKLTIDLETLSSAVYTPPARTPRSANRSRAPTPQIETHFVAAPQKHSSLNERASDMLSASMASISPVERLGTRSMSPELATADRSALPASLDILKPRKKAADSPVIGTQQRTSSGPSPVLSQQSATDAPWLRPKYAQEPTALSEKSKYRAMTPDLMPRDTAASPTNPQPRALSPEAVVITSRSGTPAPSTTAGSGTSSPRTSTADPAATSTLASAPSARASASTVTSASVPSTRVSASTESSTSIPSTRVSASTETSTKAVSRSDAPSPVSSAIKPPATGTSETVALTGGMSAPAARPTAPNTDAQHMPLLKERRPSTEPPHAGRPNFGPLKTGSSKPNPHAIDPQRNGQPRRALSPDERLNRSRSPMAGPQGRPMSPEHIRYGPRPPMGPHNRRPMSPDDPARRPRQPKLAPNGRPLSPEYETRRGYPGRPGPADWTHPADDMRVMPPRGMPPRSRNGDLRGPGGHHPARISPRFTQERPIDPRPPTRDERPSLPLSLDETLSQATSTAIPSIVAVDENHDLLQDDGAIPPSAITGISVPQSRVILSKLAKQSENQHERYEALRAERQRLTTSMSATLRDGTSSQDTINALAKIQLALNTVNSSIDICIAKFKAIDCRKEEVMAMILAQLPGSIDYSSPPKPLAVKSDLPLKETQNIRKLMPLTAPGASLSIDTGRTVTHVIEIKNRANGSIIDAPLPSPLLHIRNPPAELAAKSVGQKVTLKPAEAFELLKLVHGNDEVAAIEQMAKHAVSTPETALPPPIIDFAADHVLKAETPRSPDPPGFSTASTQSEESLAAHDKGETELSPEDKSRPSSLQIYVAHDILDSYYGDSDS